METNFEKVATFNKTAGVERNTEPLSPDVFEKHPKMIVTSLVLIREEVTELEEALLNKDLAETRDALADILYVVYGMAYRLGINADADFSLVHESNMSKFCNTEEEAQQTVAHYQQRYAANASPYPSPAYRFDNWRWVVYESSTGKILKNINYKAVDLSGSK